NSMATAIEVKEINLTDEGGLVTCDCTDSTCDGTILPAGESRTYDLDCVFNGASIGTRIKGTMVMDYTDKQTGISHKQSGKILTDLEPGQEPGSETVSENLYFTENCVPKCIKRPTVAVECPNGYKVENSWEDIKTSKRFNTPCNKQEYDENVTWECVSYNTKRKMELDMDAFVQCVEQ
ncbi:hypothetical protein ACFLYT_01745, partial [Nanoarchaeota archaeon]